MKTKLFTLFLALAASAGTMFAADKVQIGDLYYYLDAENKTAEVTQKFSYSGSIVIPESVTYNEMTYSVTSIGESAFWGCYNLTSVTIPNSVTNIGKSAFYKCTGLTSIIIPNSVTSIGESAFYGCTGLTSVTIPNSVTSIGFGAFCRTGLTSVVWNAKNCSDFSDSTTPFYSGSSTSDIRTQITSFTFGEEVKYIPAYLCDGMSNLTSIIIPNSVTNIGDYAFRGCTGITSVIWNARKCNGYKFGSQVESFVFGNEVEVIPYNICAGMTKLTSIIIPNSVTSIGSSAFYGCTGLTSVTIPNSVTSIGNNAFYNCSGLTLVTIPNSVTNIGDYAFRGCSGLTSPVYNSHVFAFMPTSYSGAYTIPNGIESIAGGAFLECAGLTSVTIPNNVTNIGYGAFHDCKGLTSPVYNSHVFAFMPTSYSGAYTIPNGIESIAGGAFLECAGLTSVTIPNSVTSIEYGAFYGCKGLTSITIPNSVTSIGDYAFYYCTGLISVTIPNSVTSIGDYAFYNCTGLISVTIPNSVTSIGDGAFRSCTRLTSITCEAVNPPTLEYYERETNNVFNTPPFEYGGNCSLYVLAGSVDAYKAAKGWKYFANILPISAKETEVVTPTVEPEVTSVDIIWPVVAGAASYELVIKDANGNVICTLTFNEKGQLTSIAFNAPGRNESQQTQSDGFAFTITGLEPGTQYTYSIIAKNASGATLHTETGTFTTKALEALEQITNDKCQMTNKVLRDGKVFILRGDRTYTLTGQEVK